MKTFKKYLTLSEDISSGLMEAGITRDIDYPEGTQVVVKSGKVKTLQTKLDKVNSKIQITAEKILTKQSGPFENVPTVELGAGKDFVYLQAGKKVFKVTGSAGGISGYFNHYKMQDGINWNTPTMETAACIGLYLDGELIKDELFELLNIAIHQFAKRQRSWFRRMEKRGVKINWIKEGNRFKDLIIEKMNKTVLPGIKENVPARIDV